MNDMIVYDGDAFEAYSKKTHELSQDTADCADRNSKEFTNLTSHGVCTKVVEDMQKDMGETSDYMATTANEFIKHGMGMIDFDKDTASKVDGLYIMQDFVANNSIEINQYNQFIVGKIDGASVNEGTKTKEANEIAESEIVAEGLADIRGASAKEEKYDETTIIGDSLLTNINKNQTQAQEYNASSSVVSQGLTNINKNQTQAQEYDASSAIRNKNLENINNNQTQAQEYDASSNVRNQSLGDISNHQTEQKEYDASSNVRNQSLGDISNHQTEQKEYDGSSNVNASILKDISGNETSKKEYEDSVVIGQSILGDITSNTVDRATKTDAVKDAFDEEVDYNKFRSSVKDDKDNEKKDS